MNKSYLLLAFIFFIGCREPVFTNERNDIVAVWKHGENVYSVSLKEGTQLIDKSFHVQVYPHFTILCDVPKGSNMWYEAYSEYDCIGDGGYKQVTIHIHSIDDISGSGWNHGKFGKGTIERLE